MTALDLPDGVLRGLVAWYSIIHGPPELLLAAVAEFHRVLAPEGRLLVAFQVGDEPLHLSEGFGHAISLDFHRLSPERIADLLERAGLTVEARLVRASPTTASGSPRRMSLARRQGDRVRGDRDWSSGPVSWRRPSPARGTPTSSTTSSRGTPLPRAARGRNLRPWAGRPR